MPMVKRSEFYRARAGNTPRVPPRGDCQGQGNPDRGVSVDL